MWIFNELINNPTHNYGCEVSVNLLTDRFFLKQCGNTQSIIWDGKTSHGVDKWRHLQKYFIHSISGEKKVPLCCCSDIWSFEENVKVCLLSAALMLKTWWLGGKQFRLLKSFQAKWEDSQPDDLRNGAFCQNVQPLFRPTGTFHWQEGSLVTGGNIMI